MRDIVIFTAIVCIMLIALLALALLLIDWLDNKRAAFYGVMNKINESLERSNRFKNK